MTGAKILYGVCGIGSGHTFRQLPMIDALSREHRIVIFAYGESHKFYSQFSKDRQSITVVPVSVPFLAGNLEGIDFAQTLRLHSARGHDHHAVNFAAMAKAAELIGKPDLVISDYEPVAAQYAYAYGSPVVTIDQQSKYLVGDFPPVLNGQGFANEIQMLRMFFPKADARIACSFFAVRNRNQPAASVTIAPPIIKDNILKMARKKVTEGNSLLVYISAQQDFVQTVTEVGRECASLKNTVAHVFAPNVDEKLAATSEVPNVRFYKHGDPRFAKILEECTGIVSTAGHTLLSEAMHLGIPAYVIPLPVYEQQMNAHVIDQNGFGKSHPAIRADALRHFIGKIPDYARAIEQDKNVLLRGSGKDQILELLRKKIEVRA